MAINPKTIKALFGKLAPMADDIAAGVAKYGDDAARAVANYGDDVAKALVADNAGRALPSLDLYDDDYLDAIEDMVNIRKRKNTALGNLFNDANQLPF